MKASRGRKGLLIAGLLVAQALAVWLYLSVERERRDGGARELAHERIDGRPVLVDAALQRDDGRVIPVDTLRGKPVLLHFWATWCPPCREELPGLLQLEAQHPGLRVVAISLDDEWPIVRDYFGGAVPPGVFREPTGQLVKAFEVSGLPDTYLLDARGGARVRFGGARTWQGDEAQAFLRGFLNAP